MPFSKNSAVLAARVGLAVALGATLSFSLYGVAAASAEASDR